jgi:hypothetical protein
MINTDTLLLQKKEAIIVASINNLAPANDIDTNPYEVKQAIRETIEIVATYPGVESFKRRILKPYTANYYVFKFQTLLIGLDLMGQAPKAALVQLNEDLANALQTIQDEIKRPPINAK